MKTLLKNLKADKSGASAAEYALVLALVAIAVVTAFTTLGTNVASRVNGAATKIGTSA
jgi:pilus assembly protein Flp/PilA